MSSIGGLPELKQILGALIFGANRPITLKEMCACIVEVSQGDPETAVFAEVDVKKVREALDALKFDLERMHTGFSVHEVAGGFRMQSDAVCGRWLKHLLKTKPQRLSQPALETMAIIAYRQPISKADIESIRGVSVAHIIKGLMEMQLVRIADRSALPGRPFLYGTTHMFLAHFGLKDLKDLDRMAPRVLSRKAPTPEETASTDSLFEQERAPQAPAAEPEDAPEPEAGGAAGLEHDEPESRKETTDDV